MDKRKIQKIIYFLVLLSGMFVFAGCQNSFQVSQSVLADTENDGQIQEQNVYDPAEPPQIADMQEAFEVILQGVSKEDIAGYAIDENFLMWFAANQKTSTVSKLAWRILDNEMEVDDWYELTGESIHVLWLRYCHDTGFQSYQLNNVLWMDCKSENETIISFTGDINFAEDWYTMEVLKEKTNGLSDCITSELMHVLNDSDILFVNNEFVYSDSENALPGKAYTFRADLERISLLQELGADIVSLGNNHTYDYGEDGLLDTMDTLEEAGIAYVGAGENIEDASKIVYMIANGKKIAFVASTDIERTTQYTKEATATEPGVLKTRNPERFINVIKEAKANSDYVIAVPHWGTEGSLYSDATQRRQAGLYASAGADVIIGGHPHRLQGIAYYEDIPVAYSLGNFWFSTGTIYTTVAQVVIDKTGELQFRFLPCEQKDLTTRLLTDKTEKDGFYHYLAKISTDVVIDEAGNVYHKKELSGENDISFPYDSASSTTDVLGSRDNDGYQIDIVGNRRK